MPEVVKLREKASTVTTSEESRSLRRQLLDISYNYHKELNEKHIISLEELGYTNCTILDFAPYVQIDIKAQDFNTNSIYQIADFTFVENVCIDTSAIFSSTNYNENNTDLALVDESTTKVKLSWNAAKAFVNGLSIIQSGNYSGDGVKIGIWDANICDTGDPKLHDLYINVKPDLTLPSQTSEEYKGVLHANTVTAIIGRIVPDAQLYSACGGIAEALGWLVAQGCDIINFSVNYQTNLIDSNGNYTIANFGYKHNLDGIFDYYSYANWLTIVVAAGNRIDNLDDGIYNPDGYVCSPGYAHNIITVGGIVRYSDNTTRYDIGACYRSGTQTKPNISAISYFTPPEYADAIGGTSIAAPMVSAACAMLIDKYPDLAYFPEEIMARLCATADTVSGYTSNYESAIDPKVGAGLLNINRLLSDYTVISDWNIGPDENSFVKEYEIQLSAGDELQCAFSWSVVTSETGVPYFADYMILLYEPDNSNNTYPDDASVLNNSNMQLIRHTAAMSGTYRLLILLDGAVSQNVDSEWFSIAYNVN